MRKRFSALAVSLAAAALLALPAISGCLQPKNPNINHYAPPEPWERAVLFNQSSAYEFVKAQCDFGYRIPGTPNNTECARWIFETLEGYNFTAEWHNFTGDRGYLNGTALHNVVGTKKGTANATLILAAHYDTRPWADTPYKSVGYDPEKPVMGANDGGSGAAVLLELAHALSSQNLTITITFMFFDGEDAGRYDHDDEWCLGSRYAAAQLSSKEMVSINKCGFILLDMVGDKNLELRREGHSSEQQNKPLLDLIWSVAAENNVTQFRNESCRPVTDDHVPFSKRGIMAVDLIHQYSGYPYFPATWHTTRDTVESVSPESLGAVGGVVERAIYVMDAAVSISLVLPWL